MFSSSSIKSEGILSTKFCLLVSRLKICRCSAPHSFSSAILILFGLKSGIGTESSIYWRSTELHIKLRNSCYLNLHFEITKRFVCNGLFERLGFKKDFENSRNRWHLRHHSTTNFWEICRLTKRRVTIRDCKAYSLSILRSLVNSCFVSSSNATKQPFISWFVNRLYF